MKGIVFTEFLEMVERRHGLDMVDALIAKAAPHSGAAYTAVGCYPHEELVSLVQALSEETQCSVSELLLQYGEYLFPRFRKLYPQFFPSKERFSDAFSFFERVDGHIHKEVLKLYPDANLPRFDTRRIDDKTLEMKYISTRHLSDLAHGLIRGCLATFGERADITARTADGGEATVFVIRRRTTGREGGK